MQLYLKTHSPARRETNLEIFHRWRDSLAQCPIMGLFASDKVLGTSKRKVSRSTQLITMFTIVSLWLMSAIPVAWASNYKARGTVYGADSNPLAGVNVKVDNETVVTGEDGKYTIMGLSGGNYTLTATKPNYITVTRNFSLGANGTVATLNFYVVPTYTVDGYVKHYPFNTPITGAKVETDGHNATVDEQGYYKITGLLDKGYTLKANKEHYQTGARGIRFSNGSSVNQRHNFNLRSNLYISNVSASTVKEGQFAFSVTVKNIDAITATNIVLKSEPLAGANLTAITADGGTCQGIGTDTLSCSLNDLASGDSTEIKLTLTKTGSVCMYFKTTANLPQDKYRRCAYNPVYLTPTCPSYKTVKRGEEWTYRMAANLNENAPAKATNVVFKANMNNGNVAFKSANVAASEGTCTATSTTISCSLRNMSPGDIVPIDVKVEAVNASHQYTYISEHVDADEYSARGCSSRIYIPHDKPGLAFVVDDTGSMSEEIDGVAEGLLTYIEGMNFSDITFKDESGKTIAQGSDTPLEQTSEYSTFELITFKDNVSTRVRTDDLNIVHHYVRSLSAHSGGDCPEASVPALNRAVVGLNDSGDILLVTDASPHERDDLQKTIATLRSKGIKVHVLLTGDCPADEAKISAVESYQSLAQGTGGTFTNASAVNNGTESGAMQFANMVSNVISAAIKPTIVAVVPSKVPQGSTVDLTIKGADTNFAESSVIGLIEGITVNSVDVISASRMIVNVTVPEETKLGFYDIGIRTPRNDNIETAFGKGVFEVVKAADKPITVSFTPLSSVINSSFTMKVRGLGTEFDGTSTLNFGDDGIKVKQVNLHNKTFLSAVVEVTEAAQIGLHTVRVETSGKNAAVAEVSQFMVMPESTLPIITSLDISKGAQGEEFVIGVIGKNTHFAAGSSVASFTGDGITVLSTEVTSETQATVTIQIARDAPVEFKNLLITTGTELASILNGFEVIPGGKYMIHGRTFNDMGAPIVGLTIQVDDKTTMTDATGYWEIMGLYEGEYTLTASQEGYTFPPKDFVVGNQSFFTKVGVTGSSLLTVKVVSQPQGVVKQGEDVTYIITVANQGEMMATNVVFEDTLQEGVSVVSLEALDGGSCDVNSISCTLPDLTAGAITTVRLVVTNLQAERLENIATVTSDEYPAEVQVTWNEVKPYLSLSISDTPDPVVMKGVLHYIFDIELNQYAPVAATGVELVTQLPKGIEVQLLTTDYGSCDTSELPTITCQIDDLDLIDANGNIADSHVTVNMEVVLDDPGLLLLTHAATVTANEYPAHTDRERTTIFIPEDIEVDMAFVIDVTGSMQEEINGVKKAITKVINLIDPSHAPLSALVVFRDNVTIEAFTSDLEILQQAVDALTASGGGTCPEAAVEALNVALPHTKAGGDILFATDASPYEDADVDKTIELLRSKGIRFNAMVTGDCSQQDSWNEVSSAE